MVQNLRDEADLCRNETATDIADLLDEAASCIVAMASQFKGAKADLAAAQERIRELETALLGVKEYREKNQLGGPAKVFDAMADAIRAGDDFNAVCADYGWCPVERAQAAEARAEALKSALLKCREEFCWHGNTGKHLSADTYASLVDMVDAAIAEGK